MNMNRFVLLIAVIMACACSAETTYDLANGDVSVPADATAVITQADRSTQLQNRIIIGNNAIVTLKGVNMAQYGQGSLIKCNGNATVILADGTVNTLDKTPWRHGVPAFEIAGSSNTTVVIKGETVGTGKLIARGSDYNTPGIGARYGGNLRIEGGGIEASGSGDGYGYGSVPGIGRCYSGDGIGDLTIQGGTVNAVGSGAGIETTRGKITISGGTVNASGFTGAGISGVNIIISGGVVNATNRYYNAGIPGIQAGTLRITDGITKVVAGSHSGTPIAATEKEISSVLEDVTSSNGRVRTLTCPYYTITWENYDGTTLGTTTGVRYGIIPSYSGSTPTKPPTAQYSYTFNGWSPAIVAATANTAYTAAYTANLRSYNITWKNCDGTTLKTDSFPYGTMPVYEGVTPTKAITPEYSYRFEEWSPKLASVTNNATYLATFTQVEFKPVISPASSTTFESSLSVSISCATEGATIHYTTDGSDPTVESPVYRRFRINGKTHVKAIAVKDGLASEVAEAEYALGRCKDPVISPTDGTVFEHSEQRVYIRCAETNGVLRYTLDGSDPTPSSPQYEGPFTISESTVVKAKVFSDTYFDSNITTASLTRVWVNVATPVIDAAESFTGSKTKVVISCATDGATVYYTLDGSEPDANSPVYTGPIYVTASCTVKAYAEAVDYLDSVVVTKAIEKVWSIGDALGKPDHGFTTGEGGTSAWTRVTDATAPNGEAMRSGVITHSECSVLSTHVMGPGTLTFSWRTSCEDSDGMFDWDHVEFSIDGSVVLQRDGINSWKEESVRIEGDGEHAVEWRYVKDYAESVGEDAAWVAGYGWASDYTETKTTDVPVPYTWLRHHDPEIIDEYDAYEAAAKDTAANGCNRVWECYALGMAPTENFRITTFPMKVDGTPDLDAIEFEPAQSKWNVPGARAKVLGKATLGGEWQVVPPGGNPDFRFFTVAVELP